MYSVTNGQAPVFSVESQREIKGHLYRPFVDKCVEFSGGVQGKDEVCEQVDQWPPRYRAAKEKGNGPALAYNW